MKLNQLLQCDYDIEITGITDISSDVKEGDLFVCVKGATRDGHDFIDDAIKNGARAILVEKDVNILFPIVKVVNTKQALVDLLIKFNGYPHEKLNLIGITGTDGKTTVATLISSLISNVDDCGYIGTNGVKSRHFKANSANTTPVPKMLHTYFKNFYDAGAKYVAMEVSSEGLMYGRVDGVNFDVAVLTNITSDHLDIHKTVDNYVKEKCKLFEKVKDNGYCILNADDAHFDEVKEHCNGNVITYGINNRADYYAYDISLLHGKTTFKLKNQDRIYSIVSPLECLFNVYNLVAALIVCEKLGFTIEMMLPYLDTLQIDGRINYINIGQDYHVIVDYAHTINGVTSLISSLKKIHSGKFYSIASVAGGRDHSKRAAMGKVYVDNMDYCIFTSELPRDENPYDVIEEMLTLVKNETAKYEVDINRMAAIRKVISMAKKDDVVLITGCGKDDYQIILKDKVYFSDYEAAKAIIMENIYTCKINDTYNK